MPIFFFRHFFFFFSVIGFPLFFLFKPEIKNV